MIVEVDKFGSALARLELARKVRIANSTGSPKAGDVVVARALSESVTYGNLELPSGRLAKINRNDVIAGVFGKRRALKGFVGDVPASVKAGDRLHLLNMGGLIGECKGHHSSFSDAIEVEVLGIVMDDAGDIVNIGTGALQPASFLLESAPIVVVAGSCMNSGKTVAATEIIKQASHAGLRVAGAKMSGVAALRDTFNMEDHGAFETASFIDCGLPSTVEVEDLAPVAKAILNHLNEQKPELIVVELGDGIVGGYSVESLLKDSDIRKATTSFVFCASDYVGVIGGDFVLRRHGIEIDVVAGSVTDSQMGEDYIQEHIGIRAGNARRDGKRLFDLIMAPQKKFEEAAA